ncbi:hypothetical protein AV530_005633 [Patagioenas fasciata monilis]|uniref:Uncharacterized protein n=1 Tax=Patagioenas fasciata monilis TaxID=372326 RepID=A0A1V4JM69_PATFA|nr:hypothetical protein AV530_005633 [Patagioenas fasciata monilis]
MKSRFKDYPCHGVWSQADLPSKGLVCPGDLVQAMHGKSVQRSSLWNVPDEYLFVSMYVAISIIPNIERYSFEYPIYTVNWISRGETVPENTKKYLFNKITRSATREQWSGD